MRIENMAILFIVVGHYRSILTPSATATQKQAVATHMYLQQARRKPQWCAEFFSNLPVRRCFKSDKYQIYLPLFLTALQFFF